MTGSMGDPNLSLDLFDIVGRLRRSADTASRYGQTDQLQRIADEIVQWQIRLRRAVTDALGTHDMNSGWDVIVREVHQMVVERDSAQQIRFLADPEIVAYSRKVAAQQEELDEQRRRTRDQ